MKKTDKQLYNSKKKEYFNPYKEQESDTYQNRQKRQARERQRSQVGEPRAKTPNIKDTNYKKTTKRSVSKKTNTRRKEQVNEQNRASGKPIIRKTKKLTNKQRRILKKRRQRRFVMRLFLMVILMVAAVMGVFFIKDQLTKTKIATQIVQMGTLNASTLFQGVVLRSEKVITAQETGNAQYVVAEGEKVKKDGLVYVLGEPGKLTTTTTQIEKVENQLYHNAESNKGLAANQNERYNLTQEIKDNFEDYYQHCFDTTTNYIYTLRSKLDANVRNRTDLYVSQEEGKEDGVVAQKVALDQLLSQYQKGKGAEHSGIVSFQMDGYETEDIEKALETMDYSTFNKLKKVSLTTQLGQSALEKDHPIYKLVLNNNWYIVTYTKENDYEQGKEYPLYFEELGNKEVLFTLVQKQEEDNKVKLVFKSSYQIGDFLDKRAVSFSIGNRAVSGLKIPVSAIVEQNYIKIPMNFTFKEDDKRGVYRKKNDKVQFIPLNIQSTDHENECYYVIQDLSDSTKVQLNDILVGEDNKTTYEVTQSKVVQGVYVVNSKIAHFKEIEIMDKSNEYAIVSYNNNTGLKELDKIIANPKNVKMDQLLEEFKIQNE